MFIITFPTVQAESIEPQHFAIDRPSKKFTSFLMKHYRLRATIPQVRIVCCC